MQLVYQLNIFSLMTIAALNTPLNLEKLTEHRTLFTSQKIRVSELHSFNDKNRLKSSNKNSIAT